MNYIQYMKPGGNFGDKLKAGIKKFLKDAGEASRMAKDARINNPGAAMIRDAYAKGDKELAKLLTDEMQAANLTGIALGSGTAPLITGFTVAPVTTGVTLATGMAGGMAGMYGTDKAINYFSDGKYTGWGDLVNQATNGAIGENTAGFFHPWAIFGGLTTGKIGNKIVGVTNRGKLELLNSALNNNIQATTLQPTVADEAILRGQLGWVPKQTIHYRHGSLDPELKTFVPKHDRWDVVTHGADPNMYFVTDLSTPVSSANMMDLRPYQYTGSIVAEKPMVQIGDFNIAGKNSTRNQLIARARQQGADTYLLQDIVDNKVPHLNIVARFIGPEGEAVQGGALLQTKATPTKTSLAFFERNPSTISKAEKAGIPKGERNNAPRHLKKYADEYDRIILESEEITPKIKATLLDLVDKYYKHSVEFPIMSIDRPKYPMVFRHGSYNKFNIFDKKYFGISDGGYHGEGFYTSPTDFRIKNPTGNTIHGERAIYSAGRSRPYVYSLYLRNPKPYTITSNHGEGFSWFNRYPEGAIITNNGNSYFNGKHFTETIFTNPTLAKLADAIVVDDLGKIIPLRNRFKWNNPDMRYKSGGKLNYLNLMKNERLRTMEARS